VSSPIVTHAVLPEVCTSESAPTVYTVMLCGWACRCEGRSEAQHVGRSIVACAVLTQSLWHTTRVQNGQKWLGGVVVMASDLRSRGREFDSRSLHCRVA